VHAGGSRRRLNLRDPRSMDAMWAFGFVGLRGGVSWPGWGMGDHTGWGTGLMEDFLWVEVGE